MITLRCPWDAPPLRSNQRLHWGAKAKLTKRIRVDAGLRAFEASRCGRFPVTGRVVVTLIWSVTDERKRDVGAASPTLKAWIDGMVDGGLLPADDHTVVAEERLRIEVGNRKGVRVEITPWSEP